MTTLFLTGCGPGRDRQEFENRRQQLCSAEEIACDARITAAAEKETVTFQVHLTCRDGEMAAVVTDPETIRDVSFRKTGTDETLEYDGLILAFSPAVDAAAPCAGGFTLLEALREGWLSSLGRAGENIAAELITPAGDTVSVWFTEEYEPVYAEIRRGESTELTLNVEHWEIKE